MRIIDLFALQVFAKIWAAATFDFFDTISTQLTQPIYLTMPELRWDCVAKLPLMRIANHDSVGRDGIGRSSA
jgi:hypothetical protein